MLNRTLSVLLLLAASPALASGHSVKRYYVSGNTSTALLAAMERQGPKGATANTEIRWAHNYKIVVRNGIYRVSDVTVNRTTIFTMPFWNGYHSASTCMKNSWDAMYASLSSHEIQHSTKADGVAAKLKAAVMAVPPQRSMAGLELKVKQAAGAVIRANETLQKKFDRDTRHGAEDPVDPVVFTHCPS